MVPVALGRLWMPVGGHACSGTRTDSSSHHQHKTAGRHTVQRTPIYPSCVWVCAFAPCECVKESGRERREDILDYSNRDRGMGTFPAEVPLKGNRFERTLTDDGDRITKSVTPTITV